MNYPDVGWEKIKGYVLKRKKTKSCGIRPNDIVRNTHFSYQQCLQLNNCMPALKLLCPLNERLYSNQDHISWRLQTGGWGHWYATELTGCTESANNSPPYITSINKQTLQSKYDCCSSSSVRANTFTYILESPGSRQHVQRTIVVQIKKSCARQQGPTK